VPDLELKMCGEKWRIVYCLQHTYPKAAKAALSHKMLHFSLSFSAFSDTTVSSVPSTLAAVFSYFGSAYFLVLNA
jgi:hypothetical protein